MFPPVCSPNSTFIVFFVLQFIIKTTSGFSSVKGSFNPGFCRSHCLRRVDNRSRSSVKPTIAASFRMGRTSTPLYITFQSGGPSTEVEPPTYDNLLFEVFIRPIPTISFWEIVLDQTRQISRNTCVSWFQLTELNAFSTLNDNTKKKSPELSGFFTRFTITPIESTVELARRNPYWCSDNHCRLRQWVGIYCRWLSS